MPNIGDRFSTLQSQMLRNANLLDRRVTHSGPDGVWYLPVTDTRELFDVDGDGKADVAVTTRVQDTGAWSYDGVTGRQGVSYRSLETLDSLGRPVDRFEELRIHRDDGRITKELRGEQEMTDLLGAIEKTTYMPDGRRSVTWQVGRATTGADGPAVIDPARTKRHTSIYD